MRIPAMPSSTLSCTTGFAAPGANPQNMAKTRNYLSQHVVGFSPLVGAPAGRSAAEDRAGPNLEKDATKKKKFNRDDTKKNQAARPLPTQRTCRLVFFCVISVCWHFSCIIFKIRPRQLRPTLFFSSRFKFFFLVGCILSKIWAPAPVGSGGLVLLGQLTYYRSKRDLL
jgi:hypothetical protein